MTVRLVIEAADPTPPYEQLRRQIVTAIESGALTPGARLPTVRQLARDLGCATGTVARTFRELEQAGYVRTGRAKGTVVEPLPAAGPPSDPGQQVDDLARAFVHQARLLAADDAQVRDAVERALGSSPEP